MKIAVKVKINSRVVKSMENAAFKAAQTAIENTLTEIRNAQVMPYATGIMQNDQTFTDVRKKGNYIDALIIVDAPQARRLYYNPQFDFQTAKNPNAGAGWFEMWGEGGKYEDFFRNAYEKNFRKELRK